MTIDPAQLYRDLGTTPVINASGNMTVLGGSRVSPKVQEAMVAANRHFVSMDDLLRRSFRAGRRLAVVVEDRFPVIPELWNTGLPEVLAHHDVRSELAPLFRYPRILHLEHDGTIRIRDAAASLFPFDCAEYVLPRGRKSSFDLHLVP